MTAEYEQFMAWYRQGGGEHATIAIANRGNLRGLFCTQAIGEGAPIMVVPTKLFIYNSEDQAKSIISKLQLEGAIPAHQPLAIRLMEERSDPNSVWAPYISVLPTQSATASPHWTKVQVELLQQSAAWPEVVAYTAALEQEFECLKDAAEHFSSYSKEEYEWARSVVLSHAFRGEAYVWTASSAMVPLLDIANHSSKGANAKIHFDSTRDAFVMTAIQDIAANEEITHTYGLQSNADLLASFGFVEPDNEVLATAIPVSLAQDQDEQHIEKMGEAMTALIEMLGEEMYCLIEQPDIYHIDDEVKKVLPAIEHLSTMIERRLSTLDPLRKEDLETNDPCELEGNALIDYNLNTVIRDEIMLLRQLGLLMSIFIDVIKTDTSPSDIQSQLKAVGLGQYVPKIRFT